MHREDLCWRQRFRAEWLQSGDCNTAYFHRKASNRKQKNTIFRLRDKDGNWCEDDDELVRVLEDYFGSIFHSRCPSEEELEAATSCITSRLTKDDLVNIERPFTEEEVYRALKDMGPIMALGPDGFHALFYQSYWGIVGSSVANACLGVLNDGQSISSINGTNIVLISMC